MTVLIYVDTSKEVGDADLDRIHRAAVSLGPTQSSKFNAVSISFIRRSILSRS